MSSHCSKAEECRAIQQVIYQPNNHQKDTQLPKILDNSPLSLHIPCIAVIASFSQLHQSLLFRFYNPFNLFILQCPILSNTLKKKIFSGLRENMILQTLSPWKMSIPPSRSLLLLRSLLHRYLDLQHSEEDSKFILTLADQQFPEGMMVKRDYRS